MKRKGISLQAWSPFLVNFFEGSIFDENKYPDINRLKVAKIIRKYKVNPNSLTKTEEAQVKEARSKIIKEANKEQSRNDAGEDR